MYLVSCFFIVLGSCALENEVYFSIDKSGRRQSEGKEVSYSS